MKHILTFLGWPLLVVPQVIFYLGAALNQLAIAINDGRMPVLDAAECNGTSSVLGEIHSCMTPASHLKIICDWINLHTTILSPGDVLLNIGDLLIGPLFWAWLTYVLYQAFITEINW